MRATVPTVATAVVTDAGICYKSIEQFVMEMYAGGFGRQPNPAEVQYWKDVMNSGDRLSSAQTLGFALFRSQYYIDRARSNEDYVFDLYRAWLQRNPEPDGYYAWLNQVIAVGREAVLDGFAYSTEFSNKVAQLCDVPSDRDADGLAEGFENQLADAFTPFYHISTEEPNSFATFQNFVPQTVRQGYGTTPVSHFRVQPLGYGYNYQGQLVSVARIDYLTLWDYDSGLPGSILCDFDFGLGFLLEGARPHRLDNERSAVLVAAPVADYTFNTDPYAYSAYSFFTTAHEGVPFLDQSRYEDFYGNPVPAGYHINLFLARSKHGTYTDNPNFYPFADPYLIDAIFDQIDDLYYSGLISELTWYATLYAASGFFYGCLVERFGEMGGRYADLRINVGEPLYPINNSAFIQDTELYNKLSSSLW